MSGVQRGRSEMSRYLFIGGGLIEACVGRGISHRVPHDNGIICTLAVRLSKLLSKRRLGSSIPIAVIIGNLISGVIERMCLQRVSGLPRNLECTRRGLARFIASETSTLALSTCSWMNVALEDYGPTNPGQGPGCLPKRTTHRGYFYLTRAPPLFTTPSMVPDTPPSISSIRTTKRKLEDAIRTLDGAVVSPSVVATIERPTPSKRPHLTPSVYSTLAKLEGTSKECSRPSSNSTTAVDVSKSVPRLTAILARSASQSKHVSPLTPPVHPASEYRPSSTESFLSRLATYKMTTYANKPPQINAVAAARCGWINEGKDRLVCGMCDVSWVLAGREGMNKDAASALIERQRVCLVEMHKEGCPWKARQCESSVYRVPLQAPTATVHDLRATALSLEPILTNVAIKHPLTPPQLSSLRSIFAVVESERSVSELDSTTEVLLDTAIVVALFGWVPAPAAALRRTASLSSCIPSSGPSASMPPTPVLSRTTSISSHLRERASARMSISQFSLSPGRISVSSSRKNPRPGTGPTIAFSQDTSLVYCVLCQRRVGLWGYARNETTISTAQNAGFASSREQQKEFDLVKEHRSYCPYVVHSSLVPTFSPASDPLGSAMEGWRAVLTVVQRYDLGQRQHLSRFAASDDDLASEVPSVELKGVEAMVASVKTNGGRELLRYVKAILG